MIEQTGSVKLLTRTVILMRVIGSMIRLKAQVFTYMYLVLDMTASGTKISSMGMERSIGPTVLFTSETMLTVLKKVRAS